MKSEQSDVLRRLVVDAIRGEAWRDYFEAAVAVADVAFEDLLEIEDAQQMLERCSMRSLHTDVTKLREWVEARMTLLARSIASSTEEGLISGYVLVGERRFSFLANTLLQEVVAEDAESRFSVVKPPKL